MPKIIILGSSNAIPDAHHENTHFVVVGKKRVVLVDCVSNPILRLKQAGVAFEQLTDLVVTHFHPDHVAGVPLLLMDMWLMGRREPLHIYGLHHTLDRIEGMMGFYDWAHWPGFFPVVFHRLPASEKTLVLECDEMRVLASPVRHLVPTIGVRFEFANNGSSAVYSCDTEPCPEVVNLAAGATVLIHESAGNGPGHTSASQAGEIARQSGAAALYLIHYPTGDFNSQELVGEAQKTFGGEVRLAEDFMVIEPGK